MFDSIISEAREKFNLGDKAGGLLSILLTLMTNKTDGGFSGFLERFREAGLGDIASSWVSSGANTPISNEQVETVFGEETLNDISDEVGLDYDTTTSATAFMTPHIVDNLTPDGVVPTDSDLLSRIGGFLTGIGGAAIGGLGMAGAATSDTVDRIGTAASGTIDVGERRVAENVDMVDAGAVAVADKSGGALHSVSDTVDGDGDSILKWLIPLLLLGLLVVLGYWFCGKSPAPTVTNTNTNTNKVNTNANTNITAKKVDSSFSIKAENGKYVISGVVPDEATKKQIMDALTAQYGAGNVNFDGLKVDAAAKPFGAGWWDNFSKMLPNLKDWKTGELSFVGNAITVASGLPQAAIDQIKSLFSGWKMPISLAGESGVTKQANEEALKELGEAKTVQQVVDALNVSIIQFDSGKSNIKSEFEPILQKAAEVLKAQPATANIEIGGHTDNIGDKDSNLKLSQARADSVKNELVKLGVDGKILTAKGYGDTMPKGDNTTKEGQFANRRIEYKVVSGDGSLTKTVTTNTNTANANK
ncbi:MAG: OmpA family protein [Acidobacteriota bacterium]|nr:OmpA family protein [Acidobacteriota bacterium]